MITGTTTSGFAFEIADDVLDNMDFCDAMNAWRKNNFAMSEVMEIMLGKDQAQALKDHVKGTAQHASAKAVNAELTEMFEVIAEKSNTGKNCSA